MNLWQILVFSTATILVFLVLSVIALGVYVTFKEQQYKLQVKYGPKTDVEVEQRANELLDELLASRSNPYPPSGTPRTSEDREDGHEPLP